MKNFKLLMMLSIGAILVQPVVAMTDSTLEVMSSVPVVTSPTIVPVASTPVVSVPEQVQVVSSDAMLNALYAKLDAMSSSVQDTIETTIKDIKSYVVQASQPVAVVPTAPVVEPVVANDADAQVVVVQTASRDGDGMREVKAKLKGDWASLQLKYNGYQRKATQAQLDDLKTALSIFETDSQDCDLDSVIGVGASAKVEEIQKYIAGLKTA